MKHIKLIIIALIILVIFISVFQNQDLFTHDYKFQLDFKLYQTPAYYVKNYALLATSFAFGIILSVFLGIFSSSGKRTQIKSKNQRIKELEKEISDIRTTRASNPALSNITSGESKTSPFTTPGGQ